MKNKLLFLFITLVFVLNLSVYVVAQETIGKEYEQTKIINKGYELAKLLPDSDTVILLELGKIISETLPQALSADQTLLAKYTNEIGKLKAKMGLDLRGVKNLAIGLKLNPISQNENDIGFIGLVMLAQGEIIDSKALSKIATRYHSGSRFRKENIENRTVYISLAPEKKTPNAITAYSKDTIVFGQLNRVKETIGESRRVSGDVLSLLDLKTAKAATFGVLFPNRLSSYPDFEYGDNDQISAAIDSIRKLKGYLDTNEGNVFLSVIAETSEAEHAKLLYEMLFGMKSLWTALKPIITTQSEGRSEKLNDSKSMLYSMLENAKISLDRKKVTLEVPKSGVNLLLKMFVEDILPENVTN